MALYMMPRVLYNPKLAWLPAPSSKYIQRIVRTNVVPTATIVLRMTAIGSFQTMAQMSPKMLAIIQEMIPPSEESGVGGGGGGGDFVIVF